MSFWVMGRLVRIPIEVVDSFISTTLTNRPFWLHGKWLKRSEVERYLKGDYDLHLLDRIGEYILMYNENIMFSTYLLHLSWNSDESEKYKKWALEGLRELREIYKEIKDCRDLNRKYELTKRLLHKSLDLGVDPF